MVWDNLVGRLAAPLGPCLSGSMFPGHPGVGCPWVVLKVVSGCMATVDGLDGLAGMPRELCLGTQQRPSL